MAEHDDRYDDYPEGEHLPDLVMRSPTIRLRLTHVERPRPGWRLDGVYHDRSLGAKSMYRVVLLHEGPTAEAVVGNSEAFDLAFMDACAKALLKDEERETNG